MAISELGTDFNSSLEFKNGDMQLVNDEQNLIQATKKRLQTILGSLSEFYLEYGSVLHRFLGWRKNETTLKFMSIELQNCLKQDPRYADFTINLNYVEKGVDIKITVFFDDDTELDMNYVLSDNGTIEEY